METKNGVVALTPSFEDFEPLCNWRQDDECETLVVHLPAFKKEELKVQITNMRILKIFGERPVDATRRKRFFKEIIVPRDCNTDQIHAKFVRDLLHIVMPKKRSFSAPNHGKTPQVLQKNGKSALEIISQQEQPIKLPTLANTSNAVPTNIVPTNNESNYQPNSSVKKLSDMVINVAVVVAMVACLYGYIMYLYWSLYVVED